MKYNTKLLFLFPVWLFIGSAVAQEQQQARLKHLETDLIDFDSLVESKVMVLGTHHFNENVLKKENQESIHKLIDLLTTFGPTKIVLEQEPKVSKRLNTDYRKYLLDTSLIDKKYNEVYQLGFRLARKMQHDSIYFFDDQTEFMGSLEGFTFDSFETYANKHDSGFHDKHLQEITQKFQNNQEVFKEQGLFNQIMLRNSPMAQKFNAQRMHSFEVRVGIQKSWIGPDWLGRFYRRNVRMLANVIKLNNAENRILIIVGDNHKWVLDYLFDNTPEFELISSWDELINHLTD